MFDPIKGIISTPEEPKERDVTIDLRNAEVIIRSLQTPMFVEDLIKFVQKTCSLTNDEVFEIINRINAELNPIDETPLINE